MYGYVSKKFFASSRYAACLLTPLPQRSSWDEVWIFRGSRYSNTGWVRPVPVIWEITMRRITLLMLLAFSLLPLPVCGDQPSTNKKEAAAPVVAKKPSTPKEKFAEIIQAAESGDAKAQFRLGVMYAKGEGVPMDAAKSLVMLRCGSGVSRQAA